MDFKKIFTSTKSILKDYWSLSISLALLLILINLVIIPIYKKISLLQERIAIEKNELETKYIRRQTIRRTLLSLQHTKTEWPKLYSSFYPEFGREVVFIDALEKIADTYNLKQNLRLEPSLASHFSGNIDEVPMQLTLIGTFPNVVAYIHALENISYILNLKELKIMRIKPEGTVQAELRYNSYWHKQ